MGSVDRDHFKSLPEPPFRGNKTLYKRAKPTSAYLEGLENYITSLHEHLLEIQKDETKILRNYAAKVHSFSQKKPSDKTKKQEDEANDEFEQVWKRVKERRKNFRDLMWDAWNERRKLLESMRIQKMDEDDLRRKLQLLATVDKDLPEHPKKLLQVDLFSILFFIMQLITIVLFGIGTEFEDDDDFATNNGTPLRLTDYYTFYTQVALFVLLGFGLLYTFMRKYAYSSLGFALLITLFAFQWTILTRVFWDNVDDVTNTDEDWKRGKLTMWMLINGMYGAATVLVSFGALLGRLKPTQIIFITFVEVLAYNLNFYVCVLVLNAVDFAGPMTIHVFGATFGLAVSYTLHLPFFEGEEDFEPYEKDRWSNYNSNLFSLIGAMIMVATLPGFNAALSPDGTQFRVAINTFLAITASIIMALIASKIFWGKLYMRDLQRGCIAGGIALASATGLIVTPGAAMFIGAVCGFVSVVVFAYLTRTLEHPKLKIFKLLDPAGVFAFNLIPGILGAIAGIVGTAIIGDDDSHYGNSVERIFVEDKNQAGYQTAALGISIGIALGIGIATGLVLFLFELVWKLFFKRFLLKGYFSDEPQWAVPSDFERTTDHSPVVTTSPATTTTTTDT